MVLPIPPNVSTFALFDDANQEVMTCQEVHGMHGFKWYVKDRVEVLEIQQRGGRNCDLVVVDLDELRENTE